MNKEVIRLLDSDLPEERTHPAEQHRTLAGTQAETWSRLAGRRCLDADGFEFRVELDHMSPQRQAAADAAFARSVEDRLRTNDSFTALAAQLRNG